MGLWGLYRAAKEIILIVSKLFVTWETQMCQLGEVKRF
jgi:hypothetical protein